MGDLARGYERGTEISSQRSVLVAVKSAFALTSKKIHCGWTPVLWWGGVLNLSFEPRTTVMTGGELVRCIEATHGLASALGP
jgi:hypothetical protein